MWSQTGETAFLPQIKGLSDLAGGLLRPRLQLAAQESTAHADLSPFGVNIFLEQEVEKAKREQAVLMAAQAGFDWLRQEFPWEDIEIHAKGDFEDRRHEPNRSSWAKYDHIVALAVQYNVGLIVRISNPPAWSRAGGNEVGTYAPPDDYNDFADFAGAVAARYRGQVRYYQIWNEPNIYPEWGVYATDPVAYTQLLKAGATAIRASDPAAVIIAGALAATIDLDGTTTGGRNFSDLLFLQRMYDAGAAPYFDIMATQGYGLWSGPTDRRMHPRVMNFGRPQFIRDLMVANGDARKPIWISEMNWNAAPADVEARYGRISEEEQAVNLPLAYQRNPRRLALAGRGQRLVSETGYRYLGAESPTGGLLPLAGAGFHAAVGLRVDSGLYRNCARRRVINEEDDRAAARPARRHLRFHSCAGRVSPLLLPHLFLSLA